jgi:hypothetical protein
VVGTSLAITSTQLSPFPSSRQHGRAWRDASPRQSQPLAMLCALWDVQVCFTMYGGHSIATAKNSIRVLDNHLRAQNLVSHRT